MEEENANLRVMCAKKINDALNIPRQLNFHFQNHDVCTLCEKTLTMCWCGEQKFIKLPDELIIYNMNFSFSLNSITH